MEEKSQMEIAYEEYLASDDKCIKIGENTFYKIINKDKISIKNGTVLICIPRELFNHTSIIKVRDEEDRIFNLGGPVHYSFRCPIPRWYMETVTLTVEGIHDIDEIGDYLSWYNNHP